MPRIKLKHRWYDGSRVHLVGEIAEELAATINPDELPSTAQIMLKGKWVMMKTIRASKPKKPDEPELDFTPKPDDKKPAKDKAGLKI